MQQMENSDKSEKTCHSTSVTIACALHLPDQSNLFCLGCKGTTMGIWTDIEVGHCILTLVALGDQPPTHLT